MTAVFRIEIISGLNKEILIELIDLFLFCIVYNLFS